MRTIRHGMITGSVLAVLFASTAGCGAQVVTGTPSARGAAPASAAPATSGLPAGPVTVVAVGDSLTAGVGDESGKGFVGLLVDNIATKPGRAESTLVNLGQSGWTSDMVVNGDGGGTPGELAQAVDEVRKAGGKAVLATVLVGSNDLWYVYENSPTDPATSADEDAAVATYRASLDRTVSELQAAGAVVVVGLPDDQTVRPSYADIDRLHQQLPDISSAEVGQMSKLSTRLVTTAQEVAAARGAPTVATEGPFWADPARMDPDGIHPNATGYTELAALWAKVVDPLLGSQ